MDTMAHGWFLLGAFVAGVVLGLAALLCGYKATDDYAREGEWAFAGLGLSVLSLIAWAAVALSLLLNVIRYAKGGA